MRSFLLDLFLRFLKWEARPGYRTTSFVTHCFRCLIVSAMTTDSVDIVVKMLRDSYVSEQFWMHQSPGGPSRGGCCSEKRLGPGPRRFESLGVVLDGCGGLGRGRGRR